MAVGNQTSFQSEMVSCYLERRQHEALVLEAFIVLLPLLSFYVWVFGGGVFMHNLLLLKTPSDMLYDYAAVCIFFLRMIMLWSNSN